MLERDEMQEKLWGKHLNLIDMKNPDASEFGTAAAERRLEIFLNALVAHASDSHSFLLAPHYGEGLTEEESGSEMRCLRSPGSLLPAMPAVQHRSSTGCFGSSAGTVQLRRRKQTNSLCGCSF
jgi:hypothetical protein